MKNLASKSTSRLPRIVNIKNSEQSVLVSWRSRLKEKPALHSGACMITPVNILQPPHQNTKKRRRNERVEILCEESTNKGATFTGEHGSAALSEPGFLLFLPFVTLNKHLFDAKQPATFPTYTHVSPFCISLSPLFSPVSFAPLPQRLLTFSRCSSQRLL